MRVSSTARREPRQCGHRLRRRHILRHYRLRVGTTLAPLTTPREQVPRPAALRPRFPHSCIATAPAHACAGDQQPDTSRGRWASCISAVASCPSETSCKPPQRRTYCRNRPPVFSLAPRCPGPCRSQKSAWRTPVPAIPFARCNHRPREFARECGLPMTRRRFFDRRRGLGQGRPEHKHAVNSKRNAPASAGPHCAWKVGAARPIQAAPRTCPTEAMAAEHRRTRHRGADGDDLLWEERCPSTAGG